MASEHDTDQQHDTTADTKPPESARDGATETAETAERVEPVDDTTAPAEPAAPAPGRTRTRKTAAKKAGPASPAKAAKTTKTATKATKAAAKTTTTTTTKAAKSTRTTKKAATAPVDTADALVDGAAVNADEATVAASMSAPAAPATRGRRRAPRPAEVPDASDPDAPTAGAESLVDQDALRFDALEAPSEPPGEQPGRVSSDAESGEGKGEDKTEEAEGTAGAYGPLFQVPLASGRRRRRASAPSSAPTAEPAAPAEAETPEPAEPATEESGDSDTAETPRRRRRRGGKGRRSRSSAAATATETAEPGDAEARAAGPADAADGGSVDADTSDDEATTSRRRTRRRRRSGGEDTEADEPGVTTKVRESRRDEVTALKGSTRLEAKKQRRREGREAGRRRTIITEAEFLARRESVERVMVVRHVGDRTQIGVLEDGVLVEHYISRETTVSMAGNIYLGRVQNVLPSMEAAFVDIGKGRNAVLYAGEVNWDAAGLEANQPKRIENALSSGQSVLVQVTKDPIGHKGARLTSQISLPGRYLVYVPNSAMTGISRKLPDTERSRLKRILKEVVPDTAGVIVRTAAEGASEEELRADVERLTATWADISAKAEAASGSGKKKNKGGSAPLLLHGEPDLTVRVIRDIFNEDFAQLVVAGDQAWQEVSEYVTSVAPDLADRVTKWTSDEDLFTHYRVDEQIGKAMDRKVWLPSGGSLVIDRTEAMTVVDVNTGKFIGSGGNLEETVTKNNLEAAEEIVRQLRLRDVGGIIVIDFIDMVLESNRDLVVRRLLECLGRDRTKHQVAEVTSLGLVQMTRKRVGSGLIEVFSETCEVCGGRGIIVHSDPVDKSGNGHEHGDNGASAGRGPNGRARGRTRTPEPPAPPRPGGPTPAQIAAAAHAAALKSSGYADVSVPEDGSEDFESLAQDGPVDVVQEHDLEEATVAPAEEFTARDAGESPVGESPVGEAPDTDATAAEEPAVEGPGADGAPALDTHTDSTEPPPADADGAGPSSAAPVAPPARPRRHRGRVVAPAGPPRSRSGGDVDPAGTAAEHDG
jgi:ribonuclease E